MKVLVLGGSGYIGKRLLETLASTFSDKPTGASRTQADSDLSSVTWIKLDICNISKLTTVLRNFDAVVNCVAGSSRSIAQGTQALTVAAREAGNPRIVHLSTMSVYGSVEGNIQEDTLLNSELGWYGRSKCAAEYHIRDYGLKAGEAVVLRPGCVFGPNSELWVGRIARWLRTGRLGDLGINGDGWSNLVNVDDVCKAVVAALNLSIRPGVVSTFNLAAPDSPRWNKYFIDLAISLQFIPINRISRRQLKLDSMLISPPLKLTQIVSKRFRGFDSKIPDYMPPGLMGVFSQQIFLDSTKASEQLGLDWIDYDTSLKNSVDWISNPTFSLPV